MSPPPLLLQGTANPINIRLARVLGTLPESLLTANVVCFLPTLLQQNPRALREPTHTKKNMFSLSCGYSFRTSGSQHLLFEGFSSLVWGAISLQEPCRFAESWILAGRSNSQSIGFPEQTPSLFAGWSEGTIFTLSLPLT